MLDRIVFELGMEDLTAIFDRKINIYQKNIWYKYLNHLTDDFFNERIKFCIENCRCMPVIADILKK